MKRKTILKVVSASTIAALMAISVVGVIKAKEQAEKMSCVLAVDLPTTNIDLNDSTESEIRSYYSSLDNKSESELQGTNLLKNLKTILKNMTYYSYDQVWEIYEITDRDWVLSPAASDSTNGVTYNSSTNKFTTYTYGSNDDEKSNPYVHTLYRDHTYNSTNIGYVNGGEIKEWGDHSAAGTNREHVWCQSRGFKASSGAKGPAGTDVHHLMSGDGNVNQAVHNNHPYGNVSSVSSRGNKTYTSNNLYGTSKTFGSGSVFEPQDEDKGNIARAIFYMCARYNNYAGTSGAISSYEPFLALANEVTSENTESSTDTTPVTMGILQDLLEWHKQDPVDEFEIHRNNLIYKNYQGNRNPFIDFPEWVDYIWGTVNNGTYNSTPTGSASPASDTINDYGTSTAPTSITLDTNSATIGIGNTKQISVSSVSPSGAYNGVNWSSSNTSVAVVSTNGTVTGVAAGTATITATSKLASNVKATCTITVQDIPVTSISLDKTTLSLKSGDRSSLTVSYLPANATAPTISWSSSDSSVATVSGGTITAMSEGTTIITASDGKGHAATCTVTVSGVAVEFSDSTYELVTSEEELDTNRKMAIVAREYNYALSTTQNSNNRARTSVVKATSENTITMTSSIATIMLEDGSKTGTYALHVTNGDSTGYLYAASSSSNYLKTQSTINDNASFSLAIDGETSAASLIAQGANTRNILRYNSSNSPYPFSCYASGQQDVCLYQQKAIPVSGDIDVTGVVLNQSSLSIVKGTSETLTATISPAEATNKNVTWSSSVESVATVEDGVVSAISVGSTVITVTTQDGGFTASCNVTVTASTAGSNNYQKQTALSSITTGQYVICSNVNGTYYPLGAFPSSASTISQNTSITVANNAISETNAANYAVTLTVSGTTVTIKNSNNKYLKLNATNKTALIASDASDNWTVALDTEGRGTFTLINAATSELSTVRGLMYSTGTSTFGGYSNGNNTSSGYYSIELFKYTEGSGSYTVDNFVEDFLKGITCNAAGTSAPTFASGTSWATLKAKFQSLTTAEQNELKNYVANENGNDEAKCVARYDYIVGKYGTNTYENFMGRTIVSHSNNLGKIIITNDSMLLLVVMSVLGTMTFVGWFIHKKRQYDI